MAARDTLRAPTLGAPAHVASAVVAVRALAQSEVDFARERAGGRLASAACDDGGWTHDDASDAWAGPHPELAAWLAGSVRQMICKRRVAKQCERLGVSVADVPDMTRSGVRECTLRMIRQMFRMFVADASDSDMRAARVAVGNMMFPDWATRNGVHFGLFISAIASQGDASQQDEWIPPAMMLNLYGCFAMTELGGGSYTKGLETTATFVPHAGEDGEGEWDLHSPTISSTKWWIGGAGETSTHAAVYARLLCGGVDHGVHTFVVQLRDPDTGSLMPGVHVGDVGAKYGRNGIDNGWIRFHHVRLPARAQLRRWAKVAPDGTYTRAVSAKNNAMAYGALLMGRASMIGDCAAYLSMATTVAVRWAVGRRQGARQQADGLPPQLMDFKTHQAKLMPLVAYAYALTVTSHRMKAMYDSLMNGLDSDDTSALPDVHATSAGLKAFCTWATAAALEVCRQSLGGHGYSSYSRLPQLVADFAVMCTWEGDNTVMALQTARYLMSSYAKVQADPRAVLAGSVRYLTDDVPSLCGAACVDDMFQPNLQLAAMRWRARTSVQRVAARLAEAKARGLTDDEAWNLHAVALVDASRSHVYLNIAAFFAVAVAKRGLEEQAAGVRPPSTSSGDAPGEVVDPLTGVRVHLSPGSAGDAKSPTVWLRAKHSRELSGQTEDSEAAATSKNGPAAVPVTCALYDVLKMMCDVFVLSHIQSDAAFYLYHGYMTPAQIDMLDAALQRCLSASRLDALALVDAFDISDYVLNAPLARADGRLYEAYFEKVQRVPEATQAAADVAAGDTTFAGRPPYFKSLIQPMAAGEDLMFATEHAATINNAAYMNDAEWAAYVRTAKPVLCDTM